MTSSLNILETMLHTWTDDEIQKAWGMIADEGKRRRNANAADKKRTLSAGDTVTFTAKGGAQVMGVITRMKYKKAIVTVTNNQGKTLNWDVPFTLLTKVAC